MIDTTACYSKITIFAREMLPWNSIICTCTKPMQYTKYRGDKHVMQLLLYTICHTEILLTHTVLAIQVTLAIHLHAHAPSIHKMAGSMSGHCQSKCEKGSLFFRIYLGHILLAQQFPIICNFATLENWELFTVQACYVMMWKADVLHYKIVKLYKFIESRGWLKRFWVWKFECTQAEFLWPHQVPGGFVNDY